MAGVALEIHHFDPPGEADAHPYRLHYALQKPGWWELVYANLDGATPLRFSTEEAAEGYGWLWMENGYYMGRDANRILVKASAAAPTSGTWKKGDRILNRDPKPGGYSGWVCVESSGQAHRAGVWKGYGLIEL